MRTRQQKAKIFFTKFGKKNYERDQAKYPRTCSYFVIVKESLLKIRKRRAMTLCVINLPDVTTQEQYILEVGNSDSVNQNQLIVQKAKKKLLLFGLENFLIYTRIYQIACF